MDIPDIAFSVQFLAPTSLSVWTQRSGRAGRSGTQAFAILLVEPTVFQVKPPPKPHASVSHITANQPQQSTGHAKSKRTKKKPGKKARDGGCAARAPVKVEPVDGISTRASTASLAIKAEVMEAAALVEARGGGTEAGAGSDTINQVAPPTSVQVAMHASAIDIVEGARHSSW